MLVTDLDYLREVADCLQEPFAYLCRHVVDSSTFQRAFGGSEHHHNFEGGLLVHTAEVVRLCEAMAGPGVDRTVLLTAAIWHDVGKIYEYEFANDGIKIEKTLYQKRIGHVVGSYLEFREYLFPVGQYTAAQQEAIGHCMLAHHGRREWGSPVEPQTKEAYILHSADMLSSRGLVK